MDIVSAFGGAGGLVGKGARVALALRAGQLADRRPGVAIGTARFLESVDTWNQSLDAASIGGVFAAYGRGADVTSFAIFAGNRIAGS